MQDYKEIVEEIRLNTKKIRQLEERNKEIFRDTRKDTEYEQNAIKADYLKLRNKILTDNARQSATEYLVPVFSEIISKYKGKQYGEKTKAKISGQMEQRTGFGVRLTETSYSTEIVFYSTNGFFGYTNTKLELTSHYKDGNSPQILSGNTIQEFDAREWYLSYCADYVENVDERTNAIIEARLKAKEAYAQAEQAFKELNALVPSSIDHVYPSNFHGYFY